MGESLDVVSGEQAPSTDLDQTDYQGDKPATSSEFFSVEIGCTEHRSLEMCVSGSGGTSPSRTHTSIGEDVSRTQASIAYCVSGSGGTLPSRTHTSIGEKRPRRHTSIGEEVSRRHLAKAALRG